MMYGLGDDGATVLDYPPSGIPVDVAGIGTGLTPCGGITTAPGFVGPIQCNAAQGGGQVNYTPGPTPLSSSLSSYLPWIVVAAVAAVVLFGGGGRR